MSGNETLTRLRDRSIGLALFLPSATIIGLARWLEPDPSGVGTHLQLGLSECFVLERMGLPCPMCGMTTTFSLMAHFDPITAILNQPFGVVLFLLTLVACTVGIMDLVRPDRNWLKAARWLGARDRSLALALLAAMIGGWLYKIVQMWDTLPGAT